MNKILIIIMLFLVIGCQKDEVIDPATYACSLTFSDNSDSHPKRARFQTAMETVLKITPGVQIAVRSKDGNVWLGSQGFADIANHIEFENCTKTMLGSVGKIYTSVLIMQLHDDNILSIDDPLSKWVDAAMVKEIENADKVSIKQLLNHTAGIKDYLETEHWVNSINTSNFKLSPREKLEYIYGKAAVHAPGEKFSYSNSHFVLLGLIIEKARGMSYKDAIATHINAPLGIKNAEAGTTENPIPAGTARPYVALRGGKYHDILDFGVSDGATGDGAIVSNMLSALVFMEAVFDHTLVSEASLNLMKSMDVKDEGSYYWGEFLAYGLALRTIKNNNGIAIGHGGSTSSYMAQLFHFPDSHVTLAIGFNGDTWQDAEFETMLKLITDIADIAHE